MSVVWNFVATKPPLSTQEAYALAARTGLRMVDHDVPCRSFGDKFGEGEFRVIGSMTWNVARQRLSLFLRSDATRDELVTAIAYAANYRLRMADTPDLAHRAWRFRPNMAAGQPYYSARICRPLADYGEDLQLIARIPDVVPTELSSGVPSV